MKVCSNINCKQINPQPMTEFYKAKGCKDGHRNKCKSCKIKEIRLYTENNKENVAKYQRGYQIKNKEKLAVYHSEYGAKYYEEKRKEINNYQAIYRSKNKKFVNQRIANWAKNNPGKRNAITVKYRTAKTKRALKWLTEEHFEQIQEFYNEATRLTKETGTLYTVDHIVPLQGENVSGLHVPWNLQILTKKDNSSKGNR